MGTAWMMMMMMMMMLRSSTGQTILCLYFFSLEQKIHFLSKNLRFQLYTLSKLTDALMVLLECIS